MLERVRVLEAQAFSPRMLVVLVVQLWVIHMAWQLQGKERILGKPGSNVRALPGQLVVGRP